MPDDNYDAWWELRASEAFDFDLWELGDLSLHEGLSASYLDVYSDFYRKILIPDSVQCLHSRLVRAFGQKDLGRLTAALDAAKATVRRAMDYAEGEAYSSYIEGNSLSSQIGNGPVGKEEPASSLSNALEMVGPESGYSAKELCAAVGLWLYGEWVANVHQKQLGTMYDEWVRAEMIESAAEAEWYRGQLDAGRNLGQSISRRNKAASDVRHGVNRQKRESAREWYFSVGVKLPTKAAAAREIASTYHVVFDVAKRWIIDFERRVTRPGPPAET